jgi:hypothetical protein
MSLINASAFDTESNSFMGLPFDRELRNLHRSLTGSPAPVSIEQVAAKEAAV